MNEAKLVIACLISREWLLIKAWERIADKVPSHESHFMFFSLLLRLILISCLFLSLPPNNWGVKPNPLCDLQRELFKWLLSSSHLIICPSGIQRRLETDQ